MSIESVNLKNFQHDNLGKFRPHTFQMAVHEIPVHVYNLRTQ